MADDNDLTSGVIDTMPAASAAEPAPAVATPEPEPVVAAVEPEPAEPAATDPAATAEPEPAKAAPKGQLPEWLKAKIAKQTHAQREAERQRDEAANQVRVLEAALEAARKGQQQPAADGTQPSGSAQPQAQPTAAPAIPAGYVRADQVQAEAARIAEINRFNEQANAAYEAGKKDFTDFDQALEPLQAMGAVQRYDFQEAALATGEAPAVLHHLGNNPDEAAKILADLEAGRVAKATAQMTKIAMEIASKRTVAKTPVSKAPAPIKPVAGSASPAFDWEKADAASFSNKFDELALQKGWYSH